jgi:alpha-tubulin suppressor-like RCC1 family protein
LHVDIHLVSPAPAVAIKQIAAHASVTLILDENGVPLSFGSATAGELGDGITSSHTTTTPTALSGHTIVAISQGSQHSLLLDDKGTVWVYGIPNNGRLGLGGNKAVATPTALTIPDGKKIKAIAAGGDHSLLLAVDGTVYSFGNAENYKLGNNDKVNPVTSPTQITIPSNKKIAYVAAGLYNSVVIAEDYTVFTFGRGSKGQNCDGTTNDVTVPTAITFPAGKKVASVVINDQHTLFLTEDHFVYACGYNSVGRLSNKVADNTISTPTQISTNFTITAIAAGPNHNLFLDTQGIVYSFGYGTYGELGQGSSATMVKAITAVTVPENKKIVTIAAADTISYICAEDHTCYAFGDASSGKLGTGDTTGKIYTPTPFGNYTYYCSNIRSDNASVCNGGGKCVSNQCKCDTGYKGANCEPLDCFGTAAGHADVCGSKGKCINKNMCQCDHGYAGFICQRDCTYCYKVYDQMTGVVSYT